MNKKKITLIVFGVIAFILLLLLGRIVETNQSGYYQVKQAALSGKLSAKLSPGVYGQLFGSIFTYKQVATVGFGDTKGEG